MSNERIKPMVVKRTSRSATVPRAVYDPTIREVIAEGNLARMKKVLARAKVVLTEQGNLRAAIKRLEVAIKARERE
jgi:hypothetical protein